jgi:hypothetical protein
MRRFLLLPIIAVACAKPPAPPTPVPAAVAPAAPIATVRPTMPRQVDGFTLLGAELGAGANDSAYRYSNGDTLTRVTAFIYRPSARFLESGDAQAAISSEGAMFGTVMNIQRQRGIYEEIKKLYSSPDSTFTPGGVRVPMHFNMATTRYRGQDVVEVQYLFYVNGWLLKVRSTVIDIGRPSSPVQPFAYRLAERLATRSRP